MQRADAGWVTLTAVRPGLADLVDGIRSEVTGAGRAAEVAGRVAQRLLHLRPSGLLALLDADERAGSADDIVRHTLHAEDGFSVVALVWRPGQGTPVHDHVAWCAFGVAQGTEYEIRYRDAGSHLVEIDRAGNEVGSVSSFAPPGDIHRVHNTGAETAISIHVYGADLRRHGSSVRREYHLPIVANRG